jgi:hypothetical protein
MERRMLSKRSSLKTRPETRPKGSTTKPATKQILLYVKYTVVGIVKEERHHYLDEFIGSIVLERENKVCSTEKKVKRPRKRRMKLKEEKKLKEGKRIKIEKIKCILY